MQMRKLKSSNYIIRNSFKNFSNSHCKFLILGGGTAGVNAAHQIISSKLGTKNDITIFDPAEFHYYQPGFTKIAGGVITKDLIINNFVKYEMKKVCSIANFKNEAVSKFHPIENMIETSQGGKYTYDKLIVAAGLQVNLNGIPGLEELLLDPSSSVSTIYDYKLSLKTRDLINNFKGGKALFTQHSAPIKCAGAPQKILYLAHDIWSSKKVNANMEFFTPLPKMFGIPYYADHLGEIAKSKGITPNFQHILTKITNDEATFKNMKTNEIFSLKYDFIHVSPPMSAPSFLKGSPISNADGFVDVTPELRHKKYPNIYSVGDCISLPCAKTASAVFSQLPILVQNMEKDIKGIGRNDGTYEGYSACPIYTKRGKLMLAEFKTYNDDKGNTVVKEDESFLNGAQTIPRMDFYYIAKAFTFIYYLSLRTNWYGKDFFIKPFYDRNTNKNDKTYRYRYFFLGWPWATGVVGSTLFLFFLFK